MAITLTVNGQAHAIDVEPDTPLLWVLRETLGLTGTKFGCGIAECGACTVHVDGKAVRSCMFPVSSADGMQITTIEGLARNGELHPVQQTWIAQQVPQCGYCQSGMMIAAVALLNRIADPSISEIKEAFSSPEPHLCRCGTYSAIIRAVRRAAVAMQ